MGSSRSTVFGRQPWINTIIGGVAGTISSKSALATKLGISESIIKRFEIVGSDVQAHISSDYSIVGSAFASNTSITSYNDMDSHCTSFGSNAFNGATNLANVYAPNAVLGYLCFLGANNLSNYLYNYEYYYLPNSVSGGISSIKIKKFTAPNLTSLINDFALGNTYLEEVNAPLENVNGSAFRNATSLDKLNTINITTLQSQSILNTKLSGAIYFPLLTNYVGGLHTLKSTEIHAPLLVTVSSKNSQFQNLINLTLFSMRKLKTLGDPTVISSCFSGLKTGCTIEVNIALATANAGAADAALVYAKTNRAAIVKFYDDAGNYVSTL